MGGIAFAFFASALALGWGAFENALLFLMVASRTCTPFRSETRSAFRVRFSNNWPIVASEAVHIGAAYVPGLSGVLEMHLDRALAVTLVPIALALLIVMQLFKLAIGRRRRR